MLKIGFGFQPCGATIFLDFSVISSKLYVICLSGLREMIFARDQLLVGYAEAQCRVPLKVQVSIATLPTAPLPHKGNLKMPTAGLASYKANGSSQF